MTKHLDLPDWLLDGTPNPGPHPDERDPPKRTARRARLRAFAAENAELERTYGHLDALGLMRLCMLRLVEQGDWPEAARIARELAPYIHERHPNVNVVRDESPGNPPPGTRPEPPTRP